MEPKRIDEILKDVRRWPPQAKDNLQFTYMRQIWDEVWKRILWEQLMGHDSPSFDCIWNKIKSILYGNSISNEIKNIMYENQW
jgi:hypothetical protein